jgi:hypothetical protein
MGWIKWEGRYEFPEGTLYILWDVGEENEYGYEIQLDFWDKEGNLDGAGCWTFGYEIWSRDVWENWGAYIEQRISEIEGNQKALELILDDLQAVDCEYILYQSEEWLYPGQEHLKDLDLVKILIEETAVTGVVA